MKAGIGPRRTRKQFEGKLAKLDAKIAGLEAGIEPYRREREMVLEMLAVHDKHHPVRDIDPGEDPRLAAEPVGEPPAELPPMLRRKP